MKTKITIKVAAIVVAGMMAFSAKAQTTHTVTCQNGTYHFLPVTVNAVVGDIMHWVYVSGVHVVGPITASDIPNGAAMWNCPIDGSNHICDYTITVAGNYHYVCHPASPHGEDAYIVVSAPLGIQQVASNNEQVSIYPNPAAAILNVEGLMVNGTSQITMYDMLGNSIYHSTFTTQHNSISVADLNEGVYTISICNNEGIVNKRVIIVR